MDWLAGFVAALPGAAILRTSPHLYLLVNAAHILAIALLVGAIVPLDLRLTGVLRGPAVNVIGPFLSRMAAAGLVLAALTGIALFSVRPAEYLANPAFLAKSGLLALAVANIAVQHRAGAFHDEAQRPAHRLFATASLVLWLAVLVGGRWIGFV